MFLTLAEFDIDELEYDKAEIGWVAYAEIDGLGKDKGALVLISCLEEEAEEIKNRLKCVG